MRLREDGQVLPVLLVLCLLLAATAIALFQVGRASSLAAEATSAADAAALAAAKNIKGQLEAQVVRFGYADVSLVSLTSARNAADDYARRNGGRVVSLGLPKLSPDGIRVHVEVEGLDALGSEAEVVRSEGARASAEATAELRPTFVFPPGIPNLGVSGVLGLIPGKDWKEFKEGVAGQPLDIVALGRFLQSQGYSVGEHPAFGGVAPVHTTNSWHYVAGAIDVNADHFPQGEMAAIDAIVGHIREMGFATIWRAPDHWDHLHVDIGAPGRIPGITRPGQYGPAVFDYVLVE